MQFPPVIVKIVQTTQTWKTDQFCIKHFANYKKYEVWRILVNYMTECLPLLYMFMYYGESPEKLNLYQ